MGQETMVLKDGSRLYGHTSIENFNNRTITFLTDSAIVVENINNIYYSAPSVQRLSSMKDKWHTWFENHPERVFVNEGRKCGRLGNISYANDTKSDFEGDAIILERSENTVKFFTINHGRVTLDKRNQVDHFEYDTRDPLALRGIIYEIEPVNGAILRGQIVEDYASRLVLLTDDGIRNIIPYSNIKAKRILPYNANISLPEQLRFFSRITYLDGNGDSKVIEGIIREIVYKPANGDKPYYEVVNIDGTTPHKYYFDDVVELSLAANKNYKEDRDVVINDNEVLIERLPATNIKHSTTSDGYEVTDTAGIVTVRLRDLDNNNVKVYFKDLPENSDFIFVEARPGVQPNLSGKIKKDKDEEKDEPTVFFTANFRDMLLNSFTPYDRFVSPASNVSVNYGPVQAGCHYLLIRKRDNSAYLIKVEP